MIQIIGTKIIMQQGESGSFRILLRDKKGKEVPLSDTDTITLRMKYSMESNIPCFKKKTKHINYDDHHYHVFQFNSADTAELPAGDYNYDVILETINKRFTIVPKSVLTLQDAISIDDIDDDQEIEIFDTETEIEYETLISSTPLVGSFNVVSTYSSTGTISDSTIDGDIITF